MYVNYVALVRSLGNNSLLRCVKVCGGGGSLHYLNK